MLYLNLYCILGLCLMCILKPEKLASTCMRFLSSDWEDDGQGT
jgi:hypothetical protein